MMQENSPTAVLKSVVSFSRDGGIANIVCDTVDGQKVALQFDVRYLWAVAADMRLASIDLLAPVPEALRSALGSQEDEDKESEAEGKKGAEAAQADADAPKSGYPGLEQAWTLCDALNDAHAEDPELGPEAVLANVAGGHFLLDRSQPVRSLPDNAGCEADLKNEFKIIYRRETNDWIPDRRDVPTEQELEVS